MLRAYGNPPSAAETQRPSDARTLDAHELVHELTHRLQASPKQQGAQLRSVLDGSKPQRGGLPAGHPDANARAALLKDEVQVEFSHDGSESDASDEGVTKRGGKIRVARRRDGPSRFDASQGSRPLGARVGGTAAVPAAVRG
jgi:hypothetical protein